MQQPTYDEQITMKNEMKLRELCAGLPAFCKEFFRGIEPTTSSRTRIAYAYDLSVFFDFLKKMKKKKRMGAECGDKNDLQVMFKQHVWGEV